MDSSQNKMGCSTERFAFLFILSLSSLPSFSVSGSLLPKLTVHVRNELRGDESVFLHCRSRDDDLGTQTLYPTQEFSWRFRVNFWYTTLFWCYAERRHSHASFNAFDTQTGILQRCNDNVCIWVFEEDGIYLRGNGMDSKRYNWEA